ncbi:Asp-tRNA(Asn)/Glu-tRNA(Gln) amidotransferase subunit GatB [Candidatus Woesearchaeota archaeon]|nr:Asp-tRNA(Asn)/Glu-tRNA(Gln) amidotransferase subunit GatB [Candidatus Woesearchaeota archaeon]
MIKIGLEAHIPINRVKTKLFCSCSLPEETSEPNAYTCVTCLGHPGSKPVLNKEAVNHALKLALALNFKVNNEIFFSRKNYFYPDMSKNFQITQYEIPLGTNGFIQLDNKKIGLKRIHLEEDPASFIHPDGMQKSSYVLVDYNRAGMPLCEIVTEAEIESPEEAREFLKKLISIIGYLGIYNPDKNPIKVDANISIKEKEYVKVEIKNISGFKEVERALSYEIDRQKNSKNVEQETRAWDSSKGMTFPLRQKEGEIDYGYIFEGDLVKVEFTKEIMNKAKKEIPELGHEKVKRYLKEYKIDKKDAEVLAQEYRLAVLFEKVAEEVNPVLAARWLRRELLKVLNYNKKNIEELELDESHLIDLLSLVESKQITDTNAKKILEKLIEKPFDVKEYVKKEGLRVIAKRDELDEICNKAINDNKKAIEDYKKGEEKALNFVIGQVMKLTKGQANPDIVRKIILEKIR